METLNNIISLACGLLGVNEQQLFSTNMESYVDARALIFTVFFDLGMTDSDTARMCHVSRQCVNKLRNGFRERMRKWTVRQAYKEIKKNLPNRPSPSPSMVFTPPSVPPLSGDRNPLKGRGEGY